MANRLSRAVAWLAALPAPLRNRATSLLFNSQVRFAGTGGLRFEKLDASEAIVVIRNRRAVQNHIGGVHAAAMALLAETATGAVFGMNVPDDRLPLLRSEEHTSELQSLMRISYAVFCLKKKTPQTTMYSYTYD